MSEQTNTVNQGLFPRGEKSDPNYFIGDAWASVLVSEESELNCPVWSVTFSPCARTNWHKHPGGQILLVTRGRGYYQEEGKAEQELHTSDVIQIPIGVKHWHGATPDSSFTHIAICTNPQNGGVQWLEALPDEAYNMLK